ncbi:MAG TPA: c-type cytochrome [Humisphaera sp.]|nr:c-type cytochrome [Humisphaera sp.]
MATARRLLCCLAVIASIFAFSLPARAQGRRGAGQALPENPADVIQTLNGFKLELVLRADPQRQGSWISMNKDDKGRLLLGGQAGQPMTRLTLQDGKVVKQEELKLPVSEVMGILWVNDALYVDGSATLPGDPAGPYGGQGRGGNARGGQAGAANPATQPADARGPANGGPATQPARAGRGRAGGGAGAGLGGPRGTYGLYRLRDPAGDGSFSSVERLRTWPRGSGEHGAHAIALAPDKQHLYVVHGNQVPHPSDASPNSPMRNFADDRAIPRREGGFMAGELPPGGAIERMDLDGKNDETFASGQRNTYDFAFNADGEVLAFDSDMEWDWGLPWYRPTRFYHAVSGGDYGYRGGSGKFPTYYEDTLPPIQNLGLGSPTGVMFGYGTKFPAKYQTAMYAMDWAYGRLFAVHLHPHGSSYEATYENFVAPKSLHSQSGKVPLNLTDMVVGDDGGFYFTCGGRNTQGYLFRVSYTGSESTAPADLHDVQGAPERDLRHKLESWHDHADVAAVDFAWPHLASDDRFIRFAARIAIEAQPVDQWKSRALAESSDPQTRIEALLALARCGGKESADEVFAALAKIPTAGLSEDLQLQKLRTLEVAISRLGKPQGDAASAIIADLDPLFPSYSAELNNELSQVLLAMDAPEAVARTVRLTQTARLIEQQIACLLYLRQIKTGWTPELRRAYFSWFNADHRDARHPEALLRWFDEAGTRYNNGNEFSLFVNNIRGDALATLTDAEKQDPELAAILSAYVPAGRGGRGGGGAVGAAAARGGANGGTPAAAVAPPAPPRRFVKEWKMDDLLPSLADVSKGRNFARGRAAFDAAQCAACHKMADTAAAGGVGPDLTAVASRFHRRDILESILEPSKVISEQFANTIVRTKDGNTVEGHIVEETEENLVLQPNPLKPDKVTIKKADINARALSKLSPMPEGLVNILDKDEILDLIAFLEAGGSADHPDFK